MLFCWGGFQPGRVNERFTMYSPRRTKFRIFEFPCPDIIGWLGFQNSGVLRYWDCGCIRECHVCHYRIRCTALWLVDWWLVPLKVWQELSSQSNIGITTCQQLGDQSINLTTIHQLPVMWPRRKLGSFLTLSRLQLALDISWSPKLLSFDVFSQRRISETSPLETVLIFDLGVWCQVIGGIWLAVRLKMNVSMLFFKTED